MATLGLVYFLCVRKNMFKMCLFEFVLNSTQPLHSSYTDRIIFESRQDENIMILENQKMGKVVDEMILVMEKNIV